MDIVELKERLLDDYDVQPGFVDQTVEQIQGFGISLQKEFYDYLDGQELSDECKIMMKEYDLLPIGAFLMRDWLEKEPEAAKFALAYWN